MKNSEMVTINISAGEIIQPGSVIELSAAHPIDPRSAQGAVTIAQCGAQRPLTVKLTKRGKVLHISTEGLDPDSYELVINELLDAKGDRLVEHLSIPFALVPITGEIPEGWRVEHAVRLEMRDLDIKRLRLGERSEAGYIDVVKAVGRSNDEAMDLAFDEAGSRVDFDEMRQTVEQRRFEKFGRVHETLWSRLDNAKDDEQIDIVVWPRLELPPAPYEKPTDQRLEEPPGGEAEVLAVVQRARSQVRDALNRVGMKMNAAEDRYTGANPSIRATATVAQIRELAQDEQIGIIFFDDQTEILDLGDSIAIARSDLAHTAGFDGTDIRVAVWESGPSVTTNLNFTDRFTTSPSASNHARLTSAVVANTELNRPHGHAPDCDLYSANTSGVDALRWAVEDEGCTVISQSFHRASEPSGSGLQSDDVLKDWLALRWPYPTILQAAGNYWLGDDDNITPPQDEYVNHKGFNSLAVGNHDDTASAMSGDSVFRNPASAHGDRELPEISANGTGVSANGQTMSGTSFAAPAVAGVTALLQDVDGVLRSWPEGCRAILLAAAGRNIEDQTWWQDVAAGVDASDGAGAVDARVGVTIAQQRRWRNASASRHGWDVGTFSSNDVGSNRLATFRYHVFVPRTLFSPTVKVALAWDSAVTSIFGFPLFSTLTVDLDLIIRDSRGNQVAVAASWDNSYEVAEFSATRGETYEIVIRRWSGTDSVWYGIAWTVDGFSFVVPWDVEFEHELVLHR